MEKKKATVRNIRVEENDYPKPTTLWKKTDLRGLNYMDGKSKGGKVQFVYQLFARIDQIEDLNAVIAEQSSKIGLLEYKLKEGGVELCVDANDLDNMKSTKEMITGKLVDMMHDSSAMSIIPTNLEMKIEKDLRDKIQKVKTDIRSSNEYSIALCLSKIEELESLIKKIMKDKLTTILDKSKEVRQLNDQMGKYIDRMEKLQGRNVNKIVKVDDTEGRNKAKPIDVDNMDFGEIMDVE